MAISCVVEYSEDYGHERFYGITPVKRQDSMGYQGRSPWLVRSEAWSPRAILSRGIHKFAEFLIVERRAPPPVGPGGAAQAMGCWLPSQP